MEVFSFTEKSLNVKLTLLFAFHWVDLHVQCTLEISILISVEVSCTEHCLVGIFILSLCELILYDDDFF